MPSIELPEYAQIKENQQNQPNQGKGSSQRAAHFEVYVKGEKFTHMWAALWPIFITLP